VDTSQPTTVIGFNGVPCTEQALRDAVAKGGTITFSCKSTPTIPITQTIQFPVDKDTTIDGGNVVTLDGGNLDAGNSTGTRIFSFNGPNSRMTKTTVTLQHIAIDNGNATGTPIAMASAPCSQGTKTDGGGGGIYVHDGILHVIDVSFTGNQAAALGPDVGGGAIFADGSLDVTIVSSQFTGNGGSNGGAIGSLNSDLTLVEDVFSNNQARGSGANSINTTSCSVAGGQVGNGGNGGAVVIDGGSDGTVTVCGCNFGHNSAGALGGGLFRAADNMTQTVNMDQTEFDANTAAQAGGAMYVHNCNLNISASTFATNSAPSAGGIQADATKINFVNDTFSNNSATMGAGGALALASGGGGGGGGGGDSGGGGGGGSDSGGGGGSDSGGGDGGSGNGGTGNSGTGSGGTIQSCTFAENHADYKMGGSAAAIAGAMVTINDTIFWDNQTMDCMSPMTCQNTNNTGQANLQWPNRHMICTDADPPCTSSGTMFADALLGALKMLGGPTQTMVPMAMSPAIGAGMGCPATDQRGVPRKTSGCTVGAVEVP
jgi:predicted outer membrane repeat protein